MTWGVPAYFHPRREAADWSRLRAAEGVEVVVVNPDSGPGAGDDDASYRGAVRGLGAMVAGYVDTVYGARPLTAVLDDAAAYRSRLGVPGVFADQVTSSPQDLEYYGQLAASLPGPLVLNPGVRPAPAYLELADVVVTFEGPWSAHVALRGPDPVGAARTWHLVHSVPPGEECRVVARARELGATHVYATSLTMPNPWATLPVGWPWTRVGP